MSDNDSSSTHSQDPQDDDWLIDAANWWSAQLAIAGKDFRRHLDAEAKRPPRRATEPLTDFDRTFETEVPKRLEPVLLLSAALLGWRLESFSDAHNRVLRHATKLGAQYLSDAAWYALDAWIAEQLFRMASCPPPEYLISPERLAHITGEPRRRRAG